MNKFSKLLAISIVLFAGCKSYEVPALKEWQPINIQPESALFPSIVFEKDTINGDSIMPMESVYEWVMPEPVFKDSPTPPNVFQSAIFVEQEQITLPAYEIRKHLSATERHEVGIDTVLVTKLFFYDQMGNKHYLNYQEIEHLTPTKQRCYWGYSEEECDCVLIGY